MTERMKPSAKRGRFWESKERKYMKYTLLKNKVTGERKCRNNDTGEIVLESAEPEKYAALRKKALANISRAERDDVMRSCGLTKVRGAQGGIYWE